MDLEAAESPQRARWSAFAPLVRPFTYLVMLAGLVFCATPWASPATALALGIAVAVVVGNPLAKASAIASRWSLQISVVLLGFVMNLHTMLAVGTQGIVFAAGTISGTLILGWFTGRMLRIETRTSLLISAGTAICGGSAIAAIGSSIEASEAQMSVAMGTVFMLNAVALYLFPWLGHQLHLSPTEFGTWAGVAIHDISSVVGAAALYGGGALVTATAVKLSRALWIVPLTAAAASHHRRTTGTVRRRGRGLRIPIPWFIALFVLASVARTWIPVVGTAAPVLQDAAEKGLTVALFLIGSGLSVAALKSVGWRPLAQGLILWGVISSVSLWVVLHTMA
ncbi:MAG: putative sulfate exporter family transporter [Gammaproteobacteria bacterium]